MAKNDPLSWRDRCGGQYAVIAADIIADAKLSDRAFRVYSLLASHAGRDTDVALLSQATMAAKLEMGIRYAERAIAELSDRGLVIKTGKARYHVVRDRSAVPIKLLKPALKHMDRRDEAADHGRRGAQKRHAEPKPNPPHMTDKPATYDGSNPPHLSPFQESSQASSQEREDNGENRDRAVSLASPPEGGSRDGFPSQLPTHTSALVGSLMSGSTEP